MSPNLFIMAQTAVNPQRWFTRSKSQPDIGTTPGASLALTEHWKSPVPGTYRHRPGAGWFLIESDADKSQPEFPDKVFFSAALDRKVLLSDYQARSTQARLPVPPTASPAGSRPSSGSRSSSPSGTKAKAQNKKDRKPKEQPMVNFVRLQDEVTWLNDKDANGELTKAPWQRFCIDEETGEFRPMLRRDDPAKRSQPPSRPASRASKVEGEIKSNASSVRNLTSRPPSPALSLRPPPSKRTSPAGTPGVMTPVRGPSPLNSPTLKHCVEPAGARE